MLAGPRGAERVHPNVILAVLSLAGAVYAVLSSAVIPALPTLQRDLQASETGVTWPLTGFTATFAMAALFLACCAAVALLIPAPAAPLRHAAAGS